MQKLVLIGFASAAGGLLRYGLGGVVQRFGGGSFPFGTIAVNVVGCLCIGALGALFAGPHLIREEIRVALLVGLLGGFTTFSSFGWETFALVNDGELHLAAINVVVTNAVGLLAVWLGYRAIEWWLGV